MLNMEQQLEALSTHQHTSPPPVEDTVAQSVEPTEPVIIEEVVSDNQQPPTEETQSTQQTQPQVDNYFNSPMYAQAPDPYEDFRRMRQRMDKAFNNRPNRMHRRVDRANKRPDYEYHFSQRVSSPKINIDEDANQYIVSVNIPGTDEDSISVNLQRQRLTIKAKQGYEKKESDPSGRFEFRQRQSGRYQRSIRLREPVDPNGMRTHVDKGVLTVTIPKVK
jgi:HSP20 family protein